MLTTVNMLVLGTCAGRWPVLKGEFKPQIIIALNEHLCLMKSHVLHESSASEMTYTVSSGALNSTHSLTA